MKIDFFKGFDVVTFGGSVVDSFIETGLPESKGKMCYPSGEKITVKDVSFYVGGGSTNTAVAFSRFGLKTGCVTKVGDDDNGARILKCLDEEKIKFLGKMEKGKNSGYSVILDSREHNRTILTFKGVNNEIVKEDIKKFNSKWIYLSSLMEKSFKTQYELAKELKSKGTMIAYNPSMYQIKEMPSRVKSLLKFCDVLVLNKEEASELVKGKSLPDYLTNLHKLGVRIVVITDKNKRVGCYDGNKMYDIKPNQEARVVERTGAGDAFASGFVAGQIVGKNIQESLELGLEEAESVLGQRGAKNNLIRRNLRK